MLRRFASVAIAALLVSASSWAADSWTIDKAHSEVNFKVRHLVSKVSGSFTDFDGKITTDFESPENASVEFVIKVASVNTNNEKRDAHLQSPDFFNVKEHPEITFRSSAITSAGDGAYHVKGTFTMLGVSKEVTLPVAFLGEVKDPWGNVKGGFEIETTVNRKEYGMEWNKALDSGGYILGDEVSVVINLEVTKE